jgi:hypothetical protein
MTAFALLLILAAAVIHASWNYFLKRSGGGTVFVWLFASLSALIYAPLVAAITPVSYVAPARGISILVAALMGTQLLAEGNVRRRLAVAMVAGLVCLAFV